MSDHCPRPSRPAPDDPLGYQDARRVQCVPRHAEDSLQIDNGRKDAFQHQDQSDRHSSYAEHSVSGSAMTLLAIPDI